MLNQVRAPPYSRPTALSPANMGTGDAAKLNPRSVMAMAVSRDSALALSVSADHLVGRYDLTVGGQAYSLKSIR